MSEENVEVVRRGYEHFAATGDFPAGLMEPDFVWDMSTFRGWPGQQTYEGVEGAGKFLAMWTAAWDEWRVDLEDLIDAGGDRVLAIVRQTGRSKSTGLRVDMQFAQLWTVRNGRQIRMEMYADAAEARQAAGLEP